jgi:hypothetical protein
MESNLPYKDIKITNHIINVCGIFLYSNDFENKIYQSGYKLNINSNYKDLFYPTYSKLLFTQKSVNKRYTKYTESEFLTLLIRGRDNNIIKEASFQINSYNLYLFEDNFGLFSLDISLADADISLSEYSDATFLLRSFGSKLKNNDIDWCQYIEKNVLIETRIRGEEILVDEFSGSKFKLYQVIQLNTQISEAEQTSLLIDLATISKIGSSISDSYDSNSKEYYQNLIDSNLISVFKNWKGLSLFDTFTILGYNILDQDWKLNNYKDLYFNIYLINIYIKYSLFRYNFQVIDFPKKLREKFENFIAEYNLTQISYNFLPNLLHNKQRVSLEIPEELSGLNDKIIKLSDKIKEEQQSKTNFILGIISFFSSLAAFSPIVDFAYELKNKVHLNNFIFYSISSILTLLITFFILYFLYPNEIKSRWGQIFSKKK